MKNNKFRVILDAKKSAQENMLIDKALVDCFEKGDLPVFRLYEWEKSITVGLNQSCDEYKELLKICDNNCYKRITGGGVLFHGHDISYTIVLERKVYSDLGVKEVYEMICQFILHFYKSIGYDACLAKYLKDIAFSKSNFCQVGIESNDIIINNQKIGGNAQKWTKDIIFQHGSIPIVKPLFDQSISGISLEELGKNISFEEAKNKILQAFKECYNVEVTPSKLEKKEFLELQSVS